MDEIEVNFAIRHIMEVLLILSIYYNIMMNDIAINIRNKIIVEIFNIIYLPLVIYNIIVGFEIINRETITNKYIIFMIINVSGIAGYIRRLIRYDSNILFSSVIGYIGLVIIMEGLYKVDIMRMMYMANYNFYKNNSISYYYEKIHKMEEANYVL
jgi:hypothetical protein